MLKGIISSRTRKEILTDYRNIKYCEIIRNKDGIFHDKILYDAQIGQAKTGFFALFRDVLNCIAYATYYGMTPVIRYRNTVEYQDVEPVNGTQNVFEYYFKQPSGIEKNQAENYLSNYCCIAKHRNIHHEGALELYGLNSEGYKDVANEKFDFYANIVHDYIRINEDIEFRIKEEMSQLSIKFDTLIGIHYRGTDFYNGWKGHPMAIAVEKYFPYVDDLDGDKDIFLATDDQNAYEKFVERYGDRIISFNAKRGTKNNPVHYGGKKEVSSRGFDLGFEVLRDVYALSFCEYLISSYSNVSFFAEVFKRSRREQYKLHQYVDVKINK